MYDLIVVGAGIFGSTLTRMARERGLSVRLVSYGIPSSRAALAVARPSWSESHEEAIDWYERIGAVAARGALVSSAVRPEPREQRDWVLIDPDKPLLKADVEGRYSWEPGSVRHTQGYGVEEGRLIVLSAPVHALAPDSYGATLVGTSGYIDTYGLRVHWLRPYHAIMAARLGEQWRLGSSVKRTQAEATERVWQMAREAAEAGILVPSDVRVIGGARYGESTQRVEYPGVVEMEGMGRLGYTMSPRLARELLDRYDQLAI